MSIKEIAGGAIIEGISHLDLAETLLCGQAFRWREITPGYYRGIVCEEAAEVHMADGALHIMGATAHSARATWRNYFDLGTDYGAIKDQLARHPALADAVRFAPGIRVLRQDSWEALISFIISQNNYVVRIAGIIDRLCRLCGSPIGKGNHAFPTPDQIAALELPDLAPLQAGYRDNYILGAARMVASGQLDLEAVSKLPTEEARAALTAIRGVGGKVADCALLYGFHRVEVCPMDVWMKRAMATLFPGGWPPDVAPVAGIAQQYIFHYARTCPDALNVDKTDKKEPAHA